MAAELPSRLVEFDKLALSGFAVIAVTVGGLVLWSATIPLSSAAIAPGIVLVESNNKTVQHLEGGVISALLVREGDRVVAGQELAQLETATFAAALARLRPLLEISMAQRARLLSEREGEIAVAFAQAESSPTLAGIIADQQRIFQTRKTSLKDRGNVLLGEKLRATARLQALIAQLEFQQQQLALTQKELASATNLASKGWTAPRRVIELDRAIAGLREEHAKLEGAAAEARAEIAQADLEYASTVSDFLGSVEIDLQVVEKHRYELLQRVNTIEDEMARTTIRAPVAGTVVNLAVHTVGGVIAPGAAVLELVPDGDPLIVEAKVRPVDIEQVRPGMPAEVRLTGPEFHTFPRLLGTVVVVSADRIADPRGEAPYFATRVRLADRSLELISPAVLRPGMPVEVLLIRRQRTALDYLISPLTDVLARAMRE